MTEPLSREQVERLNELFKLLDGTSSADECFAIVYTAFTEGRSAGDAALRAELEAVEKERDELQDQWRLVSKLDGDLDWQVEAAKLQQQLAAVTQERDEYKYRLQVHADLIGETEHGLRQQLATAQNELCTAKDQIPPDMDGDSLSVALIKLVTARRVSISALAQRERETWERAAEIVEGDCYGDIATVVYGLTEEERRHNANQIELASKIRAKAHEVQP